MQKWNKKIWNTPKTAQKVIEYIALNQPIISYQIGKDLDLSQSTANKAVHDLLDRGLIDSRRDESYVRPSGKNFLTLNLNGFCHIVGSSYKVELDDLCNKNSKLIPFVTDKWNLFHEEKVKDIAVKRLIDASLSYKFNSKYPIPSPKEYGYENTDEMIFTHAFYYPIRIGKTEEVKLWLNTCKKDDELKELLFKMINGIIDGYYQSIDLIKKYRTLITT